MARRRFIQINGECVEVEHDYKSSGRQSNAPAIICDIAPYQSMITGEMITSRSAHREHLKQHNMIEVGNEIKYISQPTKMDPPKGLKEEIIKQVNKKGL
jgi:hypothetical protein